jgi:hypothetical protein
VGITDLRIAGLGIWSVLPIIIGLALVVVGGTLAANGQTLGCMVGVVTGTGTIGLGLINKEEP